MIKVKITTERGSIERYYDEDYLYNTDWNAEVENVIDIINSSSNFTF